jgi:hypothetical protein
MTRCFLSSIALSLSATLLGCSLVSDFGGYTFGDAAVKQDEGGKGGANGGTGGGAEGTESGGGAGGKTTDRGIGGEEGLSGSGRTRDVGGSGGIGGSSENAGSGGNGGQGGSTGGSEGGTGGSAGSAGSPGCIASETPELSCGDSQDNDCDTKTDCGDSSDCEGKTCGPSGLRCKNGACECPTGNFEIAADGKDNNCDGLIDIPQIDMAFPHLNGAAAGIDVEFLFKAPMLPDWTLQCRTGRAGNTDLLAFAPCDGGLGASLVAKPFTEAQSKDPANNGAWVTEARFVFSGGAASEVFRWSYYIHESMHGAVKCTVLATDDAYFTKATERLATPDAGTFEPGVTARLRNPFIQVEYDPPLSGAFYLSGDPVKVEMLSLRRRFVLSADRKYLLITRVYESRRIRSSGNFSSCFAATLDKHNQKGNGLGSGGVPLPNEGRYHHYSCSAVVLNRAGAGVCLSATTTGVVSFASDFHNKLANLLGWNLANKFMWRQLLEFVAAKSHRTQRIFSPKCYSSTACPRSGLKPTPELYLPDRELFFP